MVALSMLDVLFSAAPPSTSQEVVGDLLHSSLEEYRQIKRMEETTSRENAMRGVRTDVKAIRQAYEQWAKEAEALLARIGKVPAADPNFPAIERLGHALGRTGAMLSIPESQHDRSYNGGETTGRTYTIEEVRRFIRSKVR